MTLQKSLAVIGLSEEEDAHLRLLLRHCAAELDPPWRMGEENGADLLIVDLHSFAGQMARTRALGAGVRCAVFVDHADPDEDGLVLERPLRRSNLIELLNSVGALQVKDAGIVPGVGGASQDFYMSDLGDEEPVEAPVAVAEPVVGLDDALRPQPVELRRIMGTSADARESTPVAVYTVDPGKVDIVSGHRLPEFLEGDFLQIPARCDLDGAPPLTLDPKNRVAYAPSGLAALEPYVHARMRRSDWRPLTGAELAQVRESQQPHPYLRLQWLYALLHAEGRLARHLDPGGTYRLKQWFEFDKSMKGYFRIAAALMQPARLHEVAAAAGAPMAEVFSFVTAADSVGLVEWTPRPPRSDEGQSHGSFFDRLRRPFERR